MARRHDRPTAEPYAAAHAGPAIELRGVRRSYGRGDGAVHALRGIDLVLDRGSFTAVMGPSGSGKSTFLQCAAGLDRPDAGQVRLGGEELTGLSENRLTKLRRRRIGFVFQSFDLLPSLTVEQNVLLPQRLAGERQDRANARRLASAMTPIVLVTAFCGTVLVIQSTLIHATGENVRAGITADHVLSAAGPGLPAGTAERAAGAPGVDAAVGVLRTAVVHRQNGRLGSAPALGVDGDPTRLLRVLDLGVRSGSLADLGRSGDTVALDATLAAKVGERVPLWLGDGTAVHPVLVAVYDRGLGFGRALLPLAAVGAHVTAGYDSQVLVADAPGADRTAVASALDGFGGLTVSDRSGFVAKADKDMELNGWANTVMAAVLGGFAAVTAANTLVMMVLDRRREVALLRLAGTTRRQVRGMLRWEALLVAAAGLTLGGVIAWITLVPVARGVAGTAPYVPATLVVPLAAGAVLLCLGAAGLPAWALLRTRPTTAGAARQ